MVFYKLVRIDETGSDYSTPLSPTDVEMIFNALEDYIPSEGDEVYKETVTNRSMALSVEVAMLGGMGEDEE